MRSILMQKSFLYLQLWKRHDALPQTSPSPLKNTSRALWAMSHSLWRRRRCNLTPLDPPSQCPLTTPTKCRRSFWKILFRLVWAYTVWTRFYKKTTKSTFPVIYTGRAQIVNTLCFFVIAVAVNGSERWNTHRWIARDERHPAPPHLPRSDISGQLID